MLESVVLTRGQVWLSPEVREMVGLHEADDQVGFAVLLEESSQQIEEKEVLPLSQCA